MRTLLVIATLVAAGCDFVHPHPDFYVNGVGVKLETNDMAWVHEDDFVERFEMAATAAARFFGGDYQQLREWVFVFTDQQRCPTGMGACAYLKSKVIYVTNHHLEENGPPAPCVEASQLIHEIGHAILPGGDRCHEDARWRHFSPLAHELAATGPIGQNGFVCVFGTTALDWMTQPGC